jgi:cation transport regulator
MFYTETSQLPVTIRETLPAQAQQIYMDAYNEAWELQPAGGHHGLSPESIAHQIAWDALNQEYVHDVKRGKWYRKDEVPAEEEPVEKAGLWAKLKKLL